MAKKTNSKANEVITAHNAALVTPTNQAIYEAGKHMLIESVSTGREFCKFMIGTSMSAIPIYLALIKFVLPDKYVPPFLTGVIALAPAVLFLVAGIVYLIGYFPQQGIASLDIPEEIERERRISVKRRYTISIAGFGIFCLAVITGILISGYLLQIQGRI